MSAESDKDKKSEDPVQSLFAALERHCRNLDGFADKGLYDNIKESAKEMTWLLSELRGIMF